MTGTAKPAPIFCQRESLGLSRCATCCDTPPCRAVAPVGGDPTPLEAAYGRLKPLLDEASERLPKVGGDAARPLTVEIDYSKGPHRLTSTAVDTPDLDKIIADTPARQARIAAFAEALASDAVVREALEWADKVVTFELDERPPGESPTDRVRVLAAEVRRLQAVYSEICVAIVAAGIKEFPTAVAGIARLREAAALRRGGRKK